VDVNIDFEELISRCAELKVTDITTSSGDKPNKTTLPKARKIAISFTQVTLSLMELQLKQVRVFVLRSSINERLRCMPKSKAHTKQNNI